MQSAKLGLKYLPINFIWQKRHNFTAGIVEKKPTDGRKLNFMGE